MAKKSQTYIWQFVIGLGFLSGFWTSVGIDPQAVFLNTLGNVVYTFYSDPMVRSIFLILPTILIIISILSAYKKGRFLGIISVSMAYIAGLVILVSTITALVLLTIAIITGYLAPKRGLVKKLTVI
jgi:membrane-bound ClpP family serine protease